MPRWFSDRQALIKQLFNEKSSSPLKMVERSYKLEKTTVQQEIFFTTTTEVQALVFNFDTADFREAFPKQKES